MKKSIIKISSALAAAILSAALLMGISCFALENAAEDTDIQAVSVQNAQETQELQEETQTADTYESRDEERSIGKSLAIGIGAGLIIAIVVCVCIKISYKTHGQTEPYKFDENAKLTLIDSSDILVNTHVKRRRIEKND